MGTDSESDAVGRIDVIALAVALKAIKKLKSERGLLRWVAGGQDDSALEAGDLIRRSEGLFVCIDDASGKRLEPLLTTQEVVEHANSVVDERFESLGCRSAYQAALNNGFEGTEAQWLESLRGADGNSVSVSEVWPSIRQWLEGNVELLRGEPGKDAAPLDPAAVESSIERAVGRFLEINPPKPGKDVSDEQVQRSVDTFLHEWTKKNRSLLDQAEKKGAPKAGPAGPVGPMPKHEWKGTAIRFEIEPGKWGKWVDLQGPAGGVAYFGVEADQNAAGISAASVYLPSPSPLNAFKVITTDESGNAVYADSGTVAHANRIVGVSANAALSGGTVTVQLSGELFNSGWNWPASALLYLGENGEIVTAQTGAFSQPIGYAESPKKIFIRVGRAVIRG